ncbi:multidrug resistance efflux pump [Kutzneria viridogrisea]|uniref:Multidrug resistance efflux pump n=1 Tax=Kutzneria viridogrisea TaxID=47990 RepID=A0ABR6BCX0_9PSEU|nr:multidrug resistance efflux pump [Kutzneria viridogrisea]
MQDERQKLLQAHYAGAVPQDLLASEMNRLTRALAEAETEIAAAKTTTRDIEATLSQALAAVRHCHEAYTQATNQTKRQINQGFFEKLFIGEDGSVERAQLTEPFAALLAGGRLFEVAQTASGTADVLQTRRRRRPEPAAQRASGDAWEHRHDQPRQHQAR